jgi:WD40 repeat protein
LTTVIDAIVCGISQSGTVRLINPDGRDERAFVGHCGPVLGLERMSDVLFASRAEDETVRVWDIRQQGPVSSVLLPRVSVCSITGCPGHVICGFHNKRLGVVELRKDHGKAVLGVQTQDYMAIALSYDSQGDSLAMFGVIDKEPMQNSMVFVDSDGQNRQRIFRRYTNFIGTGLAKV